MNDREINILPILKDNVFLWRVLKQIAPLKRINNFVFNKNLLDACLQEKPDLLFVNKAMIIKKETLEKIKKMGIKTANWFPENTYGEIYFDWFLNNFQNYDYFFTNDTRLFENFSGKSSTKFSNIPVAIDPERYKMQTLGTDDIKKYSCDVCFVGAFDAKRERILGKISELKGVTMKIFGWKSWEKSHLAPFYHGPLTIEQMVKLYNCAKICLNINIEPIINGLNLKNFEIPAAGGFQLSDYRKDIDELFVIGEEIAIYRSEEELLEKIPFYLSNEEVRNKIIEAGRKRVLTDHTLTKRIRDILTFIHG